MQTIEEKILVKVLAEAAAVHACPTDTKDIRSVKRIYESNFRKKIQESTDFSSVALKTFRVCGYNADLKTWFDEKIFFTSAGHFNNIASDGSEEGQQALEGEAFHFRPTATVGKNASVLAGGGAGDSILMPLDENNFIIHSFNPITQQPLFYGLLLPY